MKKVPLIKLLEHLIRNVRKEGKEKVKNRFILWLLKISSELDGISRRIGLQCRLKPHASKAIERDLVWIVNNSSTVAILTNTAYFGLAQRYLYLNR